MFSQLSYLFLLQSRRQDDMNKRLVIIIPALNEERTVGEVISAIPAAIPGINETKVLLVDDGSTDKTAEVARQAGASVISHRRPQGVGAAFQKGLKTALEMGADVIVNIDADGQFDPQDIPKLLAPIQAGRAEFVTTSRFVDKNLHPDMPAVKKWGNIWVTRLVNFLTDSNFTDVSCGFRAYSREAALRLTLFGRFTYTQESFIDMAFKNIAIEEVPLKVRGEREHGKSRVAANLWRYAIKSATIIFRAARDYKPFYFIGVPGLVVAAAGVAAGIFVLVHFLQTGQTFPYRSLVTGSGMLIIIGVLLFFISLLADMLHRNRLVLEEALYLARKRAYRRNNDGQEN